MMNKYIKKYLKQVSSKIDCGVWEKQALYRSLRNELEDRIEGQCFSDYDELECFLGKPELVAVEMMEAIMIADPIKSVRRKRILFTAVAILSILVVIFAILFLVGINAHSGYFEETLSVYG
jgi:hypothetical protein